MMDYLFTEEQQMIKELCRQIAVEKIKPVAAEHDENETFPWEIVKVIADADIFGLYIEEKYGGMGGGILEMSIATEELSWGCAGIALAFAATGLGTFPIILFGNEAQKEKYLPMVCKGTVAAFCLTEAEAGSDASAIKTTAKKDGDYYILNGTKQWITNGKEAGIYTVVAMTNKSKGARGASAFIVEKGTPGLSFSKKEKKLGIRGSSTTEVIFEDCKIHKDQLIAKEGMGFIVAMKTFDSSRPGVAAQAVGIAQRAIDEALAYTHTRRQFGKPITSFQGVQFMFADMATQLEAARGLVYNAAKMVDAGKKDIAGVSAMCKLYASDVAMKITTDAVQLFGGYGYMREYPVEKLMRDAKITQIYEGTNQIQRSVIAANMIKSLSKKK